MKLVSHFGLSFLRRRLRLFGYRIDDVLSHFLAEPVRCRRLAFGGRLDELDRDDGVRRIRPPRPGDLEPPPGLDRLADLERDPRLAITVFDPKHPYKDVLAIRGRAELILEGAKEHIDKLARLYTRRPFKGFRPDQTRVIVKVTPERIHLQ